MITWVNSEKLTSRPYVCGHCGRDMSSEQGYLGKGIYRDNIGQQRERVSAYIYICHNCRQPTYFSEHNKQVPGPLFGTKVEHITKPEIETLYNEARSCFTVSAFTASVMCCRKLLMNIAVEEGAEEGKSFVEYVNYLDDNGHIPKNGKLWVDSIRKLGNEANHNISSKTQEEAKLILTFTGMLLKFIYEMPGLLGTSNT